MNLIRGCGYDQAPLMIVSDYARKADETSGECLSGYYFRKLSEYLLAAKYNINQTYRTAVIKVYEKGLGVGSFKQDKRLLAELTDFHGVPKDFFVNELRSEVNVIKPTVIVAMGEYALQTLTGKANITNYRGSVMPYLYDARIKVVPTEHLSIEHTAEEQKFLIKMDLEKAVELVFTPNKPIDDHRVVICRSTNEYLQFRKNFAEFPERMVTDVETYRGFMTCASVSFDGYVGAAVPLFGSDVPIIEQTRMLHLIGQDLRAKLVGKENQNMAYDKHQYQRLGYEVEPVIWDPMLAASLIAPEFPKRLGFLTSIYCDGVYHKDEGKEFNPAKHSFDQLYTYCAKDSIKTFQIGTKQRKDLEDVGALEFMQDYMMRWFNMYYDLECTGILQDPSKQKELLGKYEGLRDIKLMELNAITGIPLKNLAYTAVGNFMEANGFPVLRHRVDSGYMIVNTDAESLRKMRSMPSHDYRKCLLPYDAALRFINLILLIRRIDKIIDYINVGVHPDGCIRTSVRLTATTSGRTANSKTSDNAYYWEYNKKGELKLVANPLGNSLQTVTKHGFIVEGEEDDDIDDGIIGKDVREMYIPDPGWVLVEIDRSQAEARVVDLLAEDYEGLEEYGKIDKHSKNAAIIYTDYTYEQIRSMYKSGNDEGAYMRQIGKKTVHATNYDMGDYRLSNLANITIQFASQALKKVHLAKPWIRGVFHAIVEQEIRTKRFLYNPLGRPRPWFKKLDSHGIKVGYSWYPQSTISDTTKEAARKTWDEMDRTRAFLVAENHDSITALVKRGYIREYIKIAVKHLLEPIDFRKGSFPRDYNLVIPCEVALSRTSWGEMKTMNKIKL